MVSRFNYRMVQRGVQTLAEDLSQLAQVIIGPEPQAEGGSPRVAASPRTVTPPEVIARELSYIATKLNALLSYVSDLREASS